MICRICETIDLPKYFQSEVNAHHWEDGYVGPSKDALCLGNLTQIYAKYNSCAFCRLVMNSIWKRWLSDGWLSAADYMRSDSKRHEKCYIYSYLYASNGEAVQGLLTPPSEPQSVVEAYRIGIGFGFSHLKTFDLGRIHCGDIQLLETSAAAIGKPRLFHGRVTDPSRVDMSLAREWLELCETTHGLKCDIPAFNLDEALPDPYPEDLIVADIQEMRLCRNPPGGRYIALSYCWAEVTSGDFLTTKSTLESLFCPNSLKQRWKDVSPVIQDASDVVLGLGERYLWVDALCIIQDDDVKKEAQIQQMDLVYGAAVLTIVSAKQFKQTEVYSGLPGFRPGSRKRTQSIEQVRDLMLTTTTLSLNLVVNDSQ